MSDFEINLTDVEELDVEDVIFFVLEQYNPLLFNYIS